MRINERPEKYPEDDPYGRTTGKRDPRVVDEEMDQYDFERDQGKWLSWMDEQEDKWPDGRRRRIRSGGLHE